MVIFAAATAAILAYTVGKPVTAKADAISAQRALGTERAIERIKKGDWPFPKNLGESEKYISVSLPISPEATFLVTIEEYNFLGTVEDFSTDESLAVIRHVLLCQQFRQQGA